MPNNGLRAPHYHAFFQFNLKLESTVPLRDFKDLLDDMFFLSALIKFVLSRLCKRDLNLDEFSIAQ